MSVRGTLRSSVRGRTRRLEWCRGGRSMRKRQARSTKKRPPARTKGRQSTAGGGAPHAAPPPVPVPPRGGPALGRGAGAGVQLADAPQAYPARAVRPRARKLLVRPTRGVSRRVGRATAPGGPPVTRPRDVCALHAWAPWVPVAG